MTDANERGERVPTHYANIVTSILTTDELVMELRRVDRSHRDLLKEGSLGPTGLTLPFSPAEILGHEPVARVVLTFEAAKGLKDYLDSNLPRMEQARKSGKVQ